MEFVKLPTGQQKKAQMLEAGEAAMLLWYAAFEHCGQDETDGFIAKGMPERLTPTRTKARIAALVRVGLWQVRAGGWQMDWSSQETRASLTTKRGASAKRQQAWRERTRNAPRNGVTNALVTRQEVEEELDAAAAASREPSFDSPAQASPAGALTGPVEILKAKLEARKLTVRWDKLTTDQVTAVEALIETHGDGPLVHAALQSYRPDSPPVFAQAWIKTWQAIPTSGRLQVVADPCTLPGHVGTTTHCAQCASERKAAR